MDLDRHHLRSLLSYAQNLPGLTHAYKRDKPQNRKGREERGCGHKRLRLCWQDRAPSGSLGFLLTRRLPGSMQGNTGVEPFTSQGSAWTGTFPARPAERENRQLLSFRESLAQRVTQETRPSQRCPGTNVHSVCARHRPGPWASSWSTQRGPGPPRPS